MSQSEKYREVYELYQLCSTDKNLKEFCIDAGVNYNKFIDWQRKQQWNEKLGRIEEVRPPVMSAVTLTDVPERLFSDTPNVHSVPSVIRSASLHLQDGTSVIVHNTTYDKMLQVFQNIELYRSQLAAANEEKGMLYAQIKALTEEVSMLRLSMEQSKQATNEFLSEIKSLHDTLKLRTNVFQTLRSNCPMLLNLYESGSRVR